MSNRYQYLVSYTLSKSEDDNFKNTGNGASSAIATASSRTISPGQADRRHRLVASGIVQLPCDILASVDRRLPIEPADEPVQRHRPQRRRLRRRPAGRRRAVQRLPRSRIWTRSTRSGSPAGWQRCRGRLPGLRERRSAARRSPSSSGSRTRSRSSRSCSTSRTARTTTCRATTSRRPPSASPRRCCRTSTRRRGRRSSPFAIASSLPDESV